MEYSGVVRHGNLLSGMAAGTHTGQPADDPAVLARLQAVQRFLTLYHPSLNFETPSFPGVRLEAWLVSARCLFLPLCSTASAFCVKCPGITSQSRPPAQLRYTPVGAGRPSMARAFLIASSVESVKGA